MPGINKIFFKWEPGLMALFFRQMAVMTGAGISVTKALNILSSENEIGVFKKLANSLSIDTVKGIPLKESLSKHPEIFDVVLVRVLIEETDGLQLAKTLNAYADSKEKLGEITSQISGAMKLPVITLSTAIVLIGCMLTFVVPVFEEMYSAMGVQLPAETLIIINFGRFLKDYGMMIAVACVTLLVILIHNRQLRYIVLRFVPGINALSKRLSAFQFIKTFSLLISLELSLQETLAFSIHGVKNTFYAEKLKKGFKNISDNEQLKSAMKETKLFPELMVQTISVGTASNSLDTVLEMTADYYQKTIDHSITKFISTFDVFILMFTGVAVGFIALSMYQPIFSLAGAVVG